MSTNVETSHVAAAAGRVRAVATETEFCAQGVLAVRHGLDMRIAASERIDERLCSLSARATQQAGELSAHSAFLSFASSRYETAESAVCGAVPGRQAAAGEARVGVFDASQASPTGFPAEDGVRPSSWNDLIRLYAGELLGADEDVQEGWVDFIGAVPALGTFLSWDEILVNLQNRDTGAAGADLVLMIASEGVEKGFGIPGVATLVGLAQSYAHLVLSDQFQNGVVDSLPDWAVTFLASDVNNSIVNAVTDVGEGISNVAQGATEAAGEVWDWVNPW